MARHPCVRREQPGAGASRRRHGDVDCRMARLRAWTVGKRPSRVPKGREAESRASNVRVGLECVGRGGEDGPWTAASIAALDFWIFLCAGGQGERSFTAGASGASSGRKKTKAAMLAAVQRPP